MQRFSAGDWFAVPLRFGLVAVGRAAAVDRSGGMLGYFFARFFERLPAGPELLGLSPGDAEIIGACTLRAFPAGAWPLIAPARCCDPRPWPMPVFRTFDEHTGGLRWSTFDPANLMRTLACEHEPADAGTRNWGLPMNALANEPLSPAAVEAALWRRFRAFQNAQHRRYIADMQRVIATRAS